MKLIKVPTSQGSLGKLGTELAPDLIIKELQNIYPIRLNLSSIKVIKSNIEETNKNILKIAKKTEHQIFIGGDHSITFPISKALSEKYENPGIIIFDAHPDSVNNFHPPTHEDFLKVIVEDNILKKGNIILVATRKIHKTEADSLKQIKVFSMRKIYNRLESTCDTIMELSRKFSDLHISIDVDAVDPAFAPAVNHPEPCGLSNLDLIYFIQRLKLLKNLKSIDIVEINPNKDINDQTVRLGARIISELL